MHLSSVPRALLWVSSLTFPLHGGCVPGSGSSAGIDELAGEKAPAQVPESPPEREVAHPREDTSVKKVSKQEDEVAPAVTEPTEPPAPRPLPTYTWHDDVAPEQTVVARVPTPKGYQRVTAEPGTFAHWLRTLPVKPGRPKVLLHDGRLKGNQSAQALVIDMDVGKRDLQQCADAVMRLRAEYLYAEKRFAAIHFNFTTGDRASYTKWRQGYRPKITGNKVRWAQTGAATTTYEGFKSYLQSVFTYAGTASLTQELSPKKVSDIEPGDVFIRGGFPGHAVIVVDVARDPDSKNPIFLLAQSYMPAQEMHVLRNPTNAAISPWYSAHFGDVLETPEWDFKRDQLKSFRDE